MAWNPVVEVPAARRSAERDSGHIRNYRDTYDWTGSDTWSAERTGGVQESWEIELRVGWDRGAPFELPDDPRGRHARLIVDCLSALDAERERRGLQVPKLDDGIGPLAELYQQILDGDFPGPYQAARASWRWWTVESGSRTIARMRAPKMARVVATLLNAIAPIADQLVDDRFRDEEMDAAAAHGEWERRNARVQWGRAGYQDCYADRPPRVDVPPEWRDTYLDGYRQAQSIRQKVAEMQGEQADPTFAPKPPPAQS